MKISLRLQDSLYSLVCKFGLFSLSRALGLFFFSFERLLVWPPFFPDTPLARQFSSDRACLIDHSLLEHALPLHF